jgi:hypothetical protein
VIDLKEGKLISFLEKYAKILQQEYQDQKVSIKFSIDPRLNGRLAELLEKNQ